MIYILNAFSLNMIPETGCSMNIRLASDTMVSDARKAVKDGIANVKSAIGHPDTARLVDFPCARETVTLQRGDTALVAQYRGPRLPEGATSLPEGASIVWYFVALT